MWQLTLPIAATDSTAAASKRVVAVVGPMFGTLERATEAFTRYEDPAQLREIVVAREPMRSNNDAMSPAQFKRSGSPDTSWSRSRQWTPPDDESRAIRAANELLDAQRALELFGVRARVDRGLHRDQRRR